MNSPQPPRFSSEESRYLFGAQSPSAVSPQPSTGAPSRTLPRSLSRFVPVLVLLVVMWVIEIGDAIIPLDFDRFSLQAWNPLSLYGLVTSPLLHAGFNHLASNSFPFLVLGLCIAAEGARRFWLVTLITGLASGLGAWLTTMPGNHIIGASGIVFGFFGYLGLRTWFEKNLLRKIIYFVIGLFVLVTYGATIVFGMLPQAGGISWQGHLFGFIGGIIAAWLLHRRSQASVGEPR